MTAATIREAARIIKDLDDKDIVTLMELGSEGTMLQIGDFRSRKKWLIGRDGKSQSYEELRPY